MGRGFVSNARFLDDKTLLMTGVEDTSTLLCSLEDGRVSSVITNHGGGIGILAPSIKQRNLFYRAAFNHYGTVRTLDLGTGMDSEFCTTADPVQALALSPGEELLAVVSGRRVDLWSVNTKRILGHPIVTPAVINAATFSPDGRHLALALGDVAGTFILHELGTATSVSKTNASGWICFYSPDGRWLATGLGYLPPRLTVRRADDLSVVSVLDAASMVNAAFSPDGKWLATVGGDASVRLWDTVTWQIRYKLSGHTDQIVGVDFSPNSRLLATRARNGEVKVWQAAEPPRHFDAAEFPESILVGIVRDGSAFWRIPQPPEPRAEGEGRESARVPVGEMWSAESMKPLETISLSDLRISEGCYDVSPGGLSFAVGCTDNTIHFRSVNHTTDLANADAGPGTLRSLQISMDGSLLVSLCGTGTVRPQGTRGSNALRASYDDWTIRAWRLPGIELVGERKGITEAQRICLSDDGKSVAIFTGRGEIGILNAPSLTAPRVWSAVGEFAVWSAGAISPDCRRVAGALGSGSAFIWDLSTRQRIALPRTLTTYSSLSFSPDATRLLASDDQAIRLFDTATGQLVLSLNEPRSKVAFTRNGQGLLGVRSDRAFMLHAPPVGALQFDWLAERTGTGDESNRLKTNPASSASLRRWDL
jgi:WD40 repeat protein